MPVPIVPIKDVMTRTMQNLEEINLRKREGAAVWEITQLVNSFCGIVLHPWEEWEEQLRAISLESLEGRRWPRLESEDEEDEEVETVGDQIRLVRNAFAHGNLIFEGEDNGEIVKIRIWNTDPKTGLRTWSSTVDVLRLEDFLRMMIEQTKGLPEPKTRTIPLHKKTAKPLKNPQCPSCNRTVKRGHPLYPSLVQARDNAAAAHLAVP